VTEKLKVLESRACIILGGFFATYRWRMNRYCYYLTQWVKRVSWQFVIDLLMSLQSNVVEVLLYAKDHGPSLFLDRWLVNAHCTKLSTHCSTACRFEGLHHSSTWKIDHTLVLLGDGWGNVNKNLPLLLSLLIRN
jgi:hypothetical protein